MKQKFVRGLKEEKRRVRGSDEPVSTPGIGDFLSCTRHPTLDPFCTLLNAAARLRAASRGA